VRFDSEAGNEPATLSGDASGEALAVVYSRDSDAEARRGMLTKDEALIWEASEPYLYLRTTTDGRVICGGEDEDFSDETKRDRRLSGKAKVLSRKLQRLLPQVDADFQFCWTGSLGQTSTGLPKIGPIPGKSRCWVALGYGGNGITHAEIASDIIVGALTGHPDVDADL
jgi:glycine/D-amino acid oxidase-like deaminating enzyme